MITALRKYDGVCFECPQFIIIHSEAGFEVSTGGGHYKSIPEADALRLANERLEAAVEHFKEELLALHTTFQNSLSDETLAAERAKACPYLYTAPDDWECAGGTLHCMLAGKTAEDFEDLRQRAEGLREAVLQVLDDMDCIADYDANDKPVWAADGRTTSCCVAARDELEAAYRAYDQSGEAKGK